MLSVVGVRHVACAVGNTFRQRGALRGRVGRAAHELLSGMSFITPCLTPAAANDLVAQLSSSGALPHACSSLGLSLWNIVRLSDAGMLDAVLDALETADVQEDELLLASSLHALELLSAHAITPNQLRKLLALFVARDRAGLTCELLRPLIDRWIEGSASRSRVACTV